MLARLLAHATPRPPLPGGSGSRDPAGAAQNNTAASFTRAFAFVPSTSPYAGAPVGSTATPPTERSLVGNSLLFQSHLYDADADLYLMKARAFDPNTGLFLQRDPSGYEDSVNLYAGFDNDPINLRDPTGEVAWTAALLYLGKRAAESAVETGIEGGIAYATGDQQFSWTWTFLKNFAVNSAIGVIPGATELKISTRAAALYSGKLALRSVGDAVLDTAVRGGSFSENLAR
ncbi:MAG: RHS repeat-associated core domain-containing protein, partial [Polyangiaceae bacterium]|nr:RHS repeat-associated core domain-containing protein [Polyangiaceae bacterium]